MDIFSPTLKGHLVSLGYDFSDKELIQFIQKFSFNAIFSFYLEIIDKEIPKYISNIK